MRTIQISTTAALLVFSFNLASAAVATSPATGVMSVNDVIALAEHGSEIVQSSDKIIASVEAEIAGRDLALSPHLIAELADDRNDLLRVSTSSGSLQSRTHSLLLTSTLSKLFSTGTTTSLIVGHETSQTNPAQYRNIETWQARISQSLWRDSFGRATSLRHESEKAELRARVLTAQYQKQSFLISVENAYWDLILALKADTIRRSNLEKGQQVEKWTRSRLRVSAAENTDVLQSQALVSSRQLELLALRNQIESAKNRLRILLPNQNPDLWNVDLADIEKDRSPESLIVGTSVDGTPMRLDSLSAQYLARQSQAEAARVRENVKPLLDAYISYGQNGADERFSNALDQAKNPDFTATRIGIQLSVDLDSNLKESLRKSARLLAEARALEASAQSRNSEVGWSDLLREINELKLQITETNRLTQLQQKNVGAERERYRLGRTTVFQLITFEVEAANSQVTLFQLFADLRKLEGQARIYTRNQNFAQDQDGI